MATPIEQGAMYRDHKTGLLVVVDTIWVDEDGEPQLQVTQYTGDPPPRAHKSAGHTDEYKASLSLHADDVREREETGQLEYLGR